MSVLHSEAGPPVPMFSLLRIPLRSRRPRKPSSRPPCRPSPGIVNAGTGGGGIRKQKRPPRVEEVAAKRVERSFSPPLAARLISFLHSFFIHQYCIPWWRKGSRSPFICYATSSALPRHQLPLFSLFRVVTASGGSPAPSSFW